MRTTQFPPGWTSAAARRGAAALVDLDAVTHNVRRLREVAGSAQVMAVVKADAYGHGLVLCARAAQAGGATWLGTALVQEALALRAAEVAGPVLALVSTPSADWEGAIAHEIDVSVGAPETLAAIVAAAHALGRPARVHLEADTGLNRGGAGPADWPELLAAAGRGQSAGAVELVGIWSQLACADTPDHPANARQQQRYAAALAAAARAGIVPQVRHLANSAAAFALPEARYDLVRPGISLYGLSPGEQVGSAAGLGLRAAMTLQSQLSLVKRVPAGEGVSYGHTYVTDRDTVLGIVPLGYGDGIPRAASGRGPVHHAGRATTVVGRVCMDQVVVDLGPGSDAAVGDPVVLFGDPATGAPTAQDWADAADTISYEIVTRLSSRVPRVHVRGGS